MTRNLIELTTHGFYCALGDFYIDPWNPVERAVITHAHADHARWGCRNYLTSHEGQHVLRLRVGADPIIEVMGYGEARIINGVRVSLHPAGHILGSAQVRVEHGGEVWVISGDYKVEPDATCTPFEAVRCHTFVTESTFGLPIYRWQPQHVIFADINTWWRANQQAGRASMLYGYTLGKAQRLLAGLDADIGPIFTHGAVEKMTQAYRKGGMVLPKTTYVGAVPPRTDWSQALIVAPPSAHATPWIRKFGSLSTGFASGWMRIRGARRRRAVDRGFVLSDHIDWSALLQTIEATGAERVWVTHGYTAVVVRWLEERGLEAHAIPTRFEGERDDSSEDETISEITEESLLSPRLYNE
ncbi:MAG: ligase-associated DNA damage response exonuclease [Chloroflexi bacterium AL-N5]|nr:ligase-associated DNA damage response exonuclease [Chloroflexi bacterium AL-N5]